MRRLHDTVPLTYRGEGDGQQSKNFLHGTTSWDCLFNLPRKGAAQWAFHTLGDVMKPSLSPSYTMLYHETVWLTYREREPPSEHFILQTMLWNGLFHLRKQAFRRCHCHETVSFTFVHKTLSWDSLFNLPRKGAAQWAFHTSDDVMKPSLSPSYTRLYHETVCLTYREREPPSEHLVHEYPEAPPVRREVVAPPLNTKKSLI
jgi:hypothetical protein